MIKIKQVETLVEAKKVGEFITSKDTFEHTWTPNEKEMAKQAPIDSLDNPNHCYWFANDGDRVVGAGGVRENKFNSDGYEMDADYFAVHRVYRRQGIAKKLLQKIEQYVKEKQGRYIHIVSCDIDFYQPARTFYQKAGYQQVAKIPDYYVEGEGRVDFFKKL